MGGAWNLINRIIQQHEQDFQGLLLKITNTSLVKVSFQSISVKVQLESDYSVFDLVIY